MTDKKLDITVRMGFPTRMGDPIGGPEVRPGVTLEISDDTARIVLLTLNLSDEQFRDLFAGREVHPEIEFANPNPERMGCEQTMWTEAFREEREALAFRTALEARGWSVNKTLTKTNSVEGRFVVTGRRWDGEEAGAYCREHRRMPLRLHVCYECAVKPPEPDA